MSKGTLKADELKVAKVTVDLLSHPAKVQALVALVDTSTGKTLAWSQADGSVWSDSTMRLLRELCVSMEEDAATRLFAESGSGPATTRKTPPTGGIGEHLGKEDVDAPSI